MPHFSWFRATIPFSWLETIETRRRLVDHRKHRWKFRAEWFVDFIRFFGIKKRAPFSTVSFPFERLRQRPSLCTRITEQRNPFPSVSQTTVYILISIERIDNFYRTEMDARVGGKEFVRTLPWNRLGYLFVRSSMQLRFSKLFTTITLLRDTPRTDLNLIFGSKKHSDQRPCVVC